MQMGVLDKLEPAAVFRIFEELCAIPHGSGNTKAISDWCVAFARARGLEAQQDGLNNVVIRKAGTPGYEDAAPVILQGHLDMVCEKAAECRKDMAREGLDLRTDGSAVWAQGTTLGGDDGIAVAMVLAILDADDLPHPPLEAVFTVDEEIGMVGASGMDMSGLQGRRMLNLDSEEEGVFTVSCAGGAEISCLLPMRREAFAGTALRLTVGGLTGGHSGSEIAKGRGNSNLLMGRLLWAVGQATPLRLAELGGGLKDNAIPRETAAVVTVRDPAAAQAACAALDAALREEFRVTDSGVFASAAAAQAGALPLDEDSTRRAVCLLSCAPNGIQVMSADIPGLVQTSLNLGILTLEGDTLRAAFCVRSSVASQKEMLRWRLECLARQLGGRIEVAGDYPGWAYAPHSPLRELAVEVYRRQSGRDARVEAIHAGVECGLFAGRLPGLDCVSLGPDLSEIHTCRERMDVGSVGRTWALVTELLRRMKD
jgi:dipeptidase D